MKISRRHFLIGTLVGTTAVSLAACGPGRGATPDGPSRTVVDVEGTEVEVPEFPQRVVTLSEPTLDGLLALGVTPVGTVTGRGQSTVSPYLQERAADIPLLGAVAQPNYEAIGEAKPDLILVDGTSINNNETAIGTLRMIAPTVYTGYAGGDWRDNLRLVAAAMNMEQQGEEVITNFDNDAGALRDELAGPYGESTFSIVRWQGNAPALILKELPAGRVLEEVGLRRPESQDRFGRGHSEPVSVENINTIDADYMFFGTLGGSSVNNPTAGGAADSEGAADALAQAEEVPGFTDLKCFQDDAIIPVDGAAWTSTGGPLLAHKILDDIRSNLL